ncbi:MAG TPA: HD domain-containing protein [Solirubrobacterales bacterium]|nr:HD domain-containing protein [Solirubrobacterales bacterium]
MARGKIEIRDPVHVFVELDDAEKELLDCRPFQRLRHINQLALSYLVYPGATHRRFEHSLGVMELATRIFDVVVDDRNIAHQSVRELVDMSPVERSYWKMVLRMAALCHDLGHLPFSHASEELLPEGWMLYEPRPEHQRVNADAARQIAAAAVERYGPDAVRFDSYDPEQTPFDFPVQTRDGAISSSTELSDVLAQVPVARFQRVYLDCQYLEDAKRWLKTDTESLIAPPSDAAGD